MSAERLVEHQLQSGWVTVDRTPCEGGFRIDFEVRMDLDYPAGEMFQQLIFGLTDTDRSWIWPREYEWVVGVLLVPASATAQQEEAYDYWRVQRDVISHGQQAILMCNGLFTGERTLEQVFRHFDGDFSRLAHVRQRIAPIAIVNASI